MAAWLKMAATLMVALLPGGLVFLIALAFGRTVHRAVKQAAQARDRDPLFAWKAVATVRLPDVWREARRMYWMSP
ncbi:MAG: hypothetical protein IRZ16_14205 [Myxococcaceae bacterium]|nr:hypothetical protein [Myxococcaceae bacterium]